MITLDFDNGGRFNPLGAKPHKMVKHTQTICPQQPTNCFSVFDHFVGLALKGLKCNTVAKEVDVLQPFHVTRVFLYPHEKTYGFLFSRGIERD